MEDFKSSNVLRNQANWEALHFYQKSKALYQITYNFSKRFLFRGDRTIDQMVQAARSGKQNIVEGSADGVTSTQMEINLINVARSSIKELREDYEDYLISRGLTIWTSTHPRFNSMVSFCRSHNRLEDYQPFIPRWNDEELANVALSLCHFIDKMMVSYEKYLEQAFITEGGIKERMTAARLGYRTNQREELNRLHEELAATQSQLSAALKKLSEADST